MQPKNSNYDISRARNHKRGTVVGQELSDLSFVSESEDEEEQPSMKE